MDSRVGPRLIEERKEKKEVKGREKKETGSEGVKCWIGHIPM